jgi:recombination DNA repair RAD52 pathway protein
MGKATRVEGPKESNSNQVVRRKKIKVTRVNKETRRKVESKVLKTKAPPKARPTNHEARKKPWNEDRMKIPQEKAKDLDPKALIQSTKAGPRNK